MKKFALLTLSFTCSGLLLGCNAQVDSDYRGESLATVHGSVVLSGGAHGGDLRAALLNYNFVKNDFARVDGAPVVGSFPADFELDLKTPPPDDALNDFTDGGKYPSESHFSAGYLAVVESGKDVNADPSAVAGVASDYVLVYVQSDVQPGTESARFLGGELKAGYHLMKSVPMSDAERAALQADCAPSSEVLPHPDICGAGDATDKLVPNADEFAADVTVTLVAPDQLQGANIF